MAENEALKAELVAQTEDSNNCEAQKAIYDELMNEKDMKNEKAGLDCSAKVSKISRDKEKLSSINKQLLKRMKTMETKFMEEQERSRAVNTEKLVAQRDE